MFPNYCFTKSAKRTDFDFGKRHYTSRDGHKRSGRPSERSTSFSRNETPRRGMRYLDVPEPRYLGSGHGKRSKQKLPRSSSIKNSSFKHSSGSKRTSSPRNVAFRLPAAVCVSKESMTDSRTSVRAPAGDDNARHHHHDCDPPADVQNDPNRALQESFADFFSIIHDNVVDTVQGAVEKMVSKCFEESLAKIDRLSAEMRLQEKILNKIYRDINAKIDDQNSTSLNQFKFVTQMLIDNQTVHYRALNQAKLSKRRRSAEQDEQEQERERRKTRLAGGNVDKEPPIPRGPQHQLWQQQVPNIYNTEMCQTCKREDCKKWRPSPPTEPPPKRRLQNGISASSMPNLTKQALSEVNRVVQPDVHSLKSRLNYPPSRSRAPRQEPTIARPVLAYPPPFRSDTASRRRLKGGSSVEHL